MSTKIKLRRDYNGCLAGSTRITEDSAGARELERLGICYIIDDEYEDEKTSREAISRMVDEVLAEAAGKTTGSFNPASVVNFNDDAEKKRKFWFGEDAPSYEDFGVESIGEFVKCVRDKSFSASGKALSSLVNTDGGYLVPEDFSTAVITSVLADLPWLQKLFQITMDGSTKKIPCLVDQDRSGSSGGMYGLGLPGKRSIQEGSALSDISPTFGMLELHLNKVGGYAYVSNEMLDDSPVAIGELLQKVFADSLTFDMADQVVNGSGAGECQGLLNSPSKIEIAKESAQTADTIVFANILKMWSRLAPEAKKDAVWLINDDCIPQLYTMSVDSSGNSPVMIVNKDASKSLGNNIFGRPVYWCEAAATLGDAGDVILFSPSSVALAKKPQGIRIESSVHERFTNDQATFRALLRLDSQSLWKTARTPLKSSSTVSNIVTIAARA